MKEFDHSALGTAADGNFYDEDPGYSRDGSEISVFNESDGMMYDFANDLDMQCWATDGEATFLRTRPATADEVRLHSDVSVFF